VNLFEIIDPSKLVLEFAVPQEMSSNIRPGIAVQVQVEGHRDTIEGHIDTVIPQIDPTNRCFKCRMMINNEQLALKPGAYATVTMRYVE
jgi:hypothetical protein